ncbi:hypothetical protein Esti_000205 [Eimeria stiedai]
MGKTDPKISFEDSGPIKLSLHEHPQLHLIETSKRQFLSWPYTAVVDTRNLRNSFSSRRRATTGGGGETAAEENGRPFRFEPFPPSTGSLETFVPQGRGKEENVTLYTAATFPNPFTEPEKCTFSARQSHSWFCDPEKLLSPQEQAELEVTLLKARDERAHTCADGQTHHFQASWSCLYIAVTVMPSLLVPEGKSLQEASDDMAYQLLRQWGIGNKACHDGLVLMFVKNHLIVSLAGRAFCLVPPRKVELHLPDLGIRGQHAFERRRVGEQPAASRLHR